MNEITVLQPNVGIESIGWRESRRMSLPGPGETGGMVGGQVKQRMRSLYGKVSTREIALDMTVPHMNDPELLSPHKFEAAVLNVMDKLQANAKAHPKANHRALYHLHKVNKAREVWRLNFDALQLV